MENRIYITVFCLAALAWTILSPDPALATYDYGQPEGGYTHQFAHIFFIISMGILIYRLKNKNLYMSSGWKFIQYSALFFILWNLDAFALHLLEDRFNIIQVKTIGPWQMKIIDSFDNNLLKFFYYLARMDYLLCMPAFIFLYYGLRSLLTERRTKILRPDVSRKTQV